MWIEYIDEKGQNHLVSLAHCSWVNLQAQEGVDQRPRIFIYGTPLANELHFHQPIKTIVFNDHSAAVVAWRKIRSLFAGLSTIETIELKTSKA